eukprot:6832871-Pyramimonas_sp.AAC.1
MQKSIAEQISGIKGGIVASVSSHTESLVKAVAARQEKTHFQLRSELEDLRARQQVQEQTQGDFKEQLKQIRDALYVAEST